MSDGSIVVSTKLDNNGIKKDIQEVNKVVENAGKTISNNMNKAETSVKKVGTAFKNIDISKVTKQMDNITKSIENTNAKIEVQKSKLAGLKTAYEGATDTKSKNKIQEQMLNTESTIINLESKLGTLGTRWDGLNTKITSTKSVINDLDGEFKTASVSASKSIDNTTKSLDNMKKKTEEVIKTTNLADIGENISKVGDKVSSVGNKLIMGVTLPLVGVGVAATKVGLDFDSQMSRVKAISGATGEKFVKLKNQAIDLGASTAFSAKESALGMENLASAGFTTNEIMTAMPGMLDLAASSGEGLASSADIAASTLRGFGLAADQAGHVADVLAKNASATNAAVGDTGEAMKYVAPAAHSAGLGIEEVTAAIGIMSNSGVKGSQAGTTLRSALTRLASPSKEAAGAMDSMGFSAFDNAGKMLSLKEMITDLKTGMKDLTDQEKQDKIATIFGQEAMSGILTLIDAGPQALDDLTNSYKNSDGAAKEMATTMQDNAKSAIEQMTGSMETAAIKVEENFAPMITDLANYIGNLADEFGALTPEQQKFYVELLAGAAALGPVVKGVGFLTSGTGGLIKLLSKLVPTTAGAITSIEGIAGAGTIGAEGVATLGTSLGGLAVAAAPFILAAAAVGVAGYGVYESMTQKAVPSIDLFADKFEYATQTVQTQSGTMQKIVETGMTKISDSTKQAVQSYLDMDNNAKSYLQDLYLNNSIITDNIVNDTKTKFDNMANNTISGYEKQKNDGISKLNDLFSKEKNLTTEEQAAILQKTNEYYTSKEAKVNENEARINEIIQSAKDSNTSLTSDQVQEITTLQNEMRENAINALSQQESEAAVILQRMKDYDGQTTAEQASEKIKALNDSRDSAIQSANDEYDQKISIISDMRDNVGSITAEEADKMIEEARRQKDETVQAAQDTRDGAVSKIEEMNSTISSSVDTNTGNILTTWDKLKTWWNSWQPQPKTVTITTKTEAIQVNTANAMNSMPWADNNQYLQIGQGNYTGTTTLKTGLSHVNEHGYETAKNSNVKMLSNGLAFLIGNHYSGGDGINDHMTTVNEMNNDINNAVDTRFSTLMAKLLSGINYQSNILGEVEANTSKTVENGQKNIALSEKLATNLVDKMNGTTGTFGGLQGELISSQMATDKAKNMKIEDNKWYSDSKAKLDDVVSQIDALKDKSQDISDSIEGVTDKAAKKNAEVEKNAISKQQRVLEKQKDALNSEVNYYKDAAQKEIDICKDNAKKQEEIVQAKKDRLTKLAEATTTAIKAQLEEEKTAAEKVINDELDLLEKKYNNEYDNIDKLTKKKSDAIDKEIAALDKQTTEISRADEKAAANDNINILTIKMNNTASLADKRALALQIADAKKELNNKENAWDVEDKKAQLESEKTSLSNKAEVKKTALKKDYDREKAANEKKLKATDDYYSKLLETDSLNAQTRYTLLNNNNNELVVLLNSYAPNWQNAGQSLADSLLTGLNSSKQSVQDAVNEMVSLRSSMDSSNSSVSGYATGTSYNKNAGLYNVDELGWETQKGGSVAYVSKGAAINNHMQSVADMKAEISRQVSAMKNSILASQADVVASVMSNITNSTSNITNHNDHGLTFKIENLNNYSSKDTEQLMNEAESLRQRKKKY